MILFHSAYKNNLSTLQKLCVFLLLCFTFNTPKIFDSLLHIKLPDEILFWLIPILLLLLENLKNSKRISVPYFGSISFIIVWFLLSESNLFRHNIISNYDYVIELTKFFSIYAIMNIVGTNLGVIEYVLKLSLIILICMICYFYAIYLGIISSDIIVFTENDRYNIKVFHPNGMSFISVYAIFCIVSLSFLNILKNKYLILALIVFFIGIISLNASRGSFIMAIFTTAIYYYKTIQSKKAKLFLVSIASLFTIFITLDIINFDIFNDIVVLRRIVNNEGNGRETQAIASWNNFQSNPIFGVGYSKAGVNFELNTVRSNVHFTQILASCGIFFSLLYFSTLFLMFWGKKKNTINYISIFIIFICLMTENWNILFPLSFISYINYSLANFKFQ